MKSFRIVIFLALLPVAIFGVYFFYGNSQKTTIINTEQDSFGSTPPSALLNVTQPDDDDEQSLVISESRFKKKKLVKNNQRTNIKNSIHYLLFSPPQPWPENLKFPLILHLNDYHDFAYSAEYISQEKMTLRFPAFSIVPKIDNLYKNLNVETRVKKMNDPLNYAVNDYKTSKSAVNFKSFRNHAKEILPPLITLIDDVKENYPIDEKRIYLIGCGFGAATLFYLIEKNPDSFASLVALSSSWEAKDYKKFQSTPVLNLNGKMNAMFLNISAENFSANVKKNGGKAIYKGFESMPHTCSHKQFYASNVWKWMFAQKRQ